MENVKKTSELGVCYYPEHWPEDQWAEDARRMVEAGLSWVRIGEFCWSRLEPREGVFEWEWMDRAIEILGTAGLKVVLCTPTATPPRWVLTKYPDMLAYDQNGQPRRFGSRRHYCFSHAKYRDECMRIADQLGQRYGDNPYIEAWQIDNEYGCHDTSVSYSSNAREAFQYWLQQRYGSIEALNEAWGNVFWSMEYGCFGEIDLPNLTVTEPNPAHQMDFRKFSSDQIVVFNQAQIDMLRLRTQKPLIHNYMGRVTDFDHFEVGENLDIASWDSYPLGFLLDRSDQPDAFKAKFARQGDPDFQAFHHDLYRAVGKGRWWVMEQQPGPVNWAPYNPAPLPGMVRLWTWEAIAHGAEVVSYFRWRQAPFAQEQMHAGLLRSDNVDSNTLGEIQTVATEVKNLQAAPATPAAVAIVFDYPSNWAWNIQPQGNTFNYFKLVFDFYRTLRKIGHSIDILPSNSSDFGDRKLVIIPGLLSWNDNIKSAIKSFDGNLLIGPRSGSQTVEFKIPDALPPNIDGMDIKVTSVETLSPDAKVDIQTGGHFHIWREFVETTETVTLKTKDGFPALINKKNVHYLCGWPDAGSLKNILRRLGLNSIDLPDGVRVRDFGTYRLYMNYSDKNVDLEGTPLQAAGVRVINLKNNKILIET